MKDYGRLENIQAKLNWLRQESKDPNFTQYLEQMQVVLNKQCASAQYLEQEIDAKYRQYQQNMAGRVQPAPMPQPVPMPQPAPVVQPETAVNAETPVQSVPQQAAPQQATPQQATPQQAMPQPQSWQGQPQVQQPMPQFAPKKKTSMEFKIGADIFCVIGILFILVAFVMLGISYMGDLFKGICLYVVAGVVILLSELILRRRTDKLSQGFTGLGICGLYAATLINCALWDNFNTIVAAVITLVITVLAVFISRKKDSVILKVISFLGCYVSFWPAVGMEDNAGFITITAILFAVNIVSVLVPLKKNVIGVHITHMVSNTVFVLAFAIRAWFACVDTRLCCLFIFTNILIIGFILLAIEKCLKKRSVNGVYCSDTEYLILHGFMLGIQLMAFAFCAMGAGDAENVIYFLVLLALSKVLSRVKALRVSDVVITSAVALWSLYYIGSEGWHGIAFAAAFVLSIFALRYYKVFHQVVITFVVLLFVTGKLMEVSILPAVIMGVLFLFLLIFNHVKFWRDQYQPVYNYINLAVMALWCLISMFVHDYLNSAIMALIGTAVIVLVFRKKYNMDFKWKYLMLMIFWTYMALISGIEMAVIISSIMMLIAIISVILGFALKQKAVRIYGLVLSILVSLKIMFFDFSATPILERMLLFFVVGVIILAISCIYIVLEKKMSNER